MKEILNVDSTCMYRRNRSIHSSCELLFRLPLDEEFTGGVLDLEVKTSYFKEVFVPSFELLIDNRIFYISGAVHFHLVLRLVICCLMPLLMLLF